MRRGTRLHANEAGRQPRKKLQHLTAAKQLLMTTFSAG
jgi:hypothetical protein